MMMRLVMSAAVFCVLLAACSITKFADSIPSESAGSTAAPDCAVAGQECATECHPELGCVECAADGDCGIAEPICVLGSCEECDANTDCPTGHSCFPKNHACEPSCGSNDDCNPDEPICDLASGACVGCNNLDDCTTEDPICSPITQQCGECGTSDDCGAAAPHCEVTDGSCRECLTDHHCPLAAPLCVDNRCTAEPTACGPDELVCGEDGCVDVASDPQHCGDCLTSCGPAGTCVSGACNCPSVATAPGGECPTECTGGCMSTTCVIECDAESECADTALNCPARCGGKDSCRTTTINCPASYSCTTSCDGADRSCDELQVNCGDAGSCDLRCGAGEACKDAQLYCGATACIASCQGGKTPTVDCGNSCGCTSC